MMTTVSDQPMCLKSSNSVLMSFYAAKPCNEKGEYLPPHTPPQPQPTPHGKAPDPWSPLTSHIEFDFAHYHFVKAQTLAGLID
jgi:hypothetical protein